MVGIQIVSHCSRRIIVSLALVSLRSTVSSPMFSHTYYPTLANTRTLFIPSIPPVAFFNLHVVSIASLESKDPILRTNTSHSVVSLTSQLRSRQEIDHSVRNLLPRPIFHGHIMTRAFDWDKLGLRDIPPDLVCLGERDDLVLSTLVVPLGKRWLAGKYTRERRAYMHNEKTLAGLADCLEGVVQAGDHAFAPGGSEDLAEVREAFGLELTKLWY